MIQLIVFLYAGERGLRGLREYEAKVIPILHQHSGILISATSSSFEGENHPDEIHIIQFPTMQHFDEYKKDERVVSLSELRKKSIRKLEIYLTDQFHEYF